MNSLRQMTLDIRKREWDKDFLDILDIPAKILPEVRPSSGFFGRTKKEIFGEEIIAGGIAGDRQAALFSGLPGEPLRRIS